MQRLFGDFFDDFAGESLAELDRASGGFLPTVDVSETDAEVIVTAELPGIEEKDVELSLSKDALTIDGKKEQESKDDSKQYHRVERSYGSFRRVIPLAWKVDHDKVEAKYKSGVLTITLPKLPEAVDSHKKIEIKAE